MKIINRKLARSAWSRGVILYAEELAESYNELAQYYGREAYDTKELNKWLLNGAKNWNQYSYDGHSLCYNKDIAHRLCTPTELKKTQEGAKDPSRLETWLDVQARALYQASCLVVEAWLDQVFAE